jgi:uncharacterized protein YjbJ (UPF0337 family)
MDGKIDKIKGRIKETVGVIIDNDHLKREGQRDQEVGEVKEAAQQAADAVQDKAAQIAEAVRDKVKQAVDKVKNA